jgi:diaminopimelate decarboxylase
MAPVGLGSAAGHLTMDGQDLAALAAEHGSPLFVFSERQLAGNAASFRTAARAGHARARIFFASKACSNLHILKIIREQGLDIEVNSGGELWKALKAGFGPRQIVFNGVAKSAAEIREAVTQGIQAINVDSAFELARIAEVATTLGRKAAVSLRLVPGIGGGATAGIQTGSAASKFGMTEDELRAAIDIARSNPSAIAVAGLHIHIGSQVLDAADFAQGVAFAADAARNLAVAMGHPLRHVNLGGGYPIDYTHRQKGSNEHAQFDLSAFAAPIAAPDMLGEVAAQAGRQFSTETEIFFEPGRSMVGNCGLLLSRVESTRHRGSTPWLYLDAGYNLLLDSTATRWYYHMVNASRISEPADTGFRVVGPLCDSADCFFDVEVEYLWKAVQARLGDVAGLDKDLLDDLKRKIVRLPETRDLPAASRPGDLLALLDTGAYSLEEMFQYCGRQRAKAIMIGRDDSIITLRERDRPEDLLDAAERRLLAAE